MNRRPLHPLLVHFPLALWGMSFVFDLLSLKFGAALVEAARYDLLAGLIAAVPTAATGWSDYFRRLEPGSAARRLGRWHSGFNGAAAALFTASLLLRWRIQGAPATPRVPLVLSAFGVVLLGVAAYLGGVLVVNRRGVAAS